MNTAMTRCLGIFLLAACAGARGEAAEERFAEQTLRGYGTASAVFTATADGGGSLLLLQAETPEAAARWQAKYLSDLATTTGKVEKADTPFLSFRLPGGGLAAAIRDGDRLALAHGRDAAMLRQVLHNAGFAPDAANSVAAAVIPMYLDSWDQYAFRFYYRPGERPPGLDPAEPYDPMTEFDYAAERGNLGFIYWAELHSADFANGLLNDNLWNWAYRLARQRKLPIVLNLSFSNPSWIADAFRYENITGMPHFSGSFHSIAEPHHGGTGTTSWASKNARRAELRQLGKILRKYGSADEVIELLEPHGELNHGDYTVFLEYGPLVDDSFREYLRERYETLDAVSLRYHGEPGRLADWEAVRLPEIASFAGWNDRALDLSGEWRIGRLPLAEGQPTPNPDPRGDHRYMAEPAPDEYYAAAFDDSAWPRIRRMPGSDESKFLVKRPAVLRRRFTWDGALKDRVYLYLWDLNQGVNDTVEIHLNDEKIAVDTVRHNVPHWGAYDVTDALREGDNLLALRLPKGFIGYRIYLSDEEPSGYPWASAGRNAEWVDFCGWQSWSRWHAVETGLSSLREVEPDKSIVSMAPDHYFSPLRDLNRRFGAHFHNTGYMSVVHGELLPMLMRGADLPFSLEPGGPADTVENFKRFTGFWLSSGVNAVHYFIHVGNIIWDDGIRTHFEKILPALRQMGRHHQPKADIALLFDSEAETLRGYPWTRDHNAALPSGFWSWRLNETLARDYPTDAVTLSDFDAGGLADPYKIVIDANNTVLTPAQVESIRGWVERGGVFVAMTQSGRHAPETPDSWPLAELTGFSAEVFTRYDDRLNPDARRGLVAAPGQTVFNPDIFERHRAGDGTRLTPQHPDAQALALWDDGSVAIGMRRIGEGHVIVFGNRLPYWERSSRDLLRAIPAWVGARALPLEVEPPLYPKHYVSNNGLFDVWLLWNPERNQTVPYTFRFRDDRERTLLDVETGEPMAESGELPPYEFVMALSPRHDDARAARHWFTRQRGLWQGAEKPAPAADDAEDGTDEALERHTLALDGPWDFRAIATDLDVGSVADLLTAEDGWGSLELGAWNRDIDVEGDRFLVRRTIEIPASWEDGEVLLWCTGFYLSTTLNGQATFYLNGREIAAPGANHGVAHLKLPLVSGEKATLAIDIRNRDDRVYGLKGVCFLSFLPTPRKVIDLAGVWEVTAGVDAVESARRKVPGLVDGSVVRRTFTGPEVGKGGRVVFRMVTDSDQNGVVINGHYVRRHHHRVGDITMLDIAPWVKAGEENELVIVAEREPERRRRIREALLLIYE